MTTSLHRLVAGAAAVAVGWPTPVFAVGISPLIQDPGSARANQTLAHALNDGFERRLAEGFPTALAHAVMRTEFTSTADRVRLETLAKSPDAAANPTLKFRAHVLSHDVYQMTTSNGRAFSMAVGHAPRTVAINGHEIGWASGRLDQFLADVEHALHRSYVVRAFGLESLVPRADAAAPFFFVYTLAALVVYFAYDSYTSPNFTGPPSAQSIQRLAHVADLCDAERTDDATPFEASETARTVEALAKAHVVDVAHRDHVKSCDAEVSTVVNKPKELMVPKPDPARVRAACENEARLAACVSAFKARVEAKSRQARPPAAGGGTAK